jgi:predicted transposase/invertase (TIGR01784 family)
MLGSLDNEVIFKKAFTDKTVFKSFVKDVLGIEAEFEKIETEKRFTPPVGYVDFKLDIFAESTDKRFVIELQRVEYDHHFDRFLHYFLMLIAEQQKSSKSYLIEQTVYMIVILTEPYTISEKNGKPIRDEVLLIKINPKTLKGFERDIYGHQFICLNPNHPEEDTPQSIRDWLDLIYQSIHNPQRPVLNTNHIGIKKAIELISFENLTPEERAEAKMKEEAKIAKAVYEVNSRNLGRLEGKIEGKSEIALNLIKDGLSDEKIAQYTGLEIEKIQILRKEHNN